MKIIITIGNDKGNLPPFSFFAFFSSSFVSWYIVNQQKMTGKTKNQSNYKHLVIIITLQKSLVNQ